MFESQFIINMNSLKAICMEKPYSLNVIGISAKLLEANEFENWNNLSVKIKKLKEVCHGVWSAFLIDYPEKKCNTCFLARSRLNIIGTNIAAFQVKFTTTCMYAVSNQYCKTTAKHFHKAIKLPSHAGPLFQLSLAGVTPLSREETPRVPSVGQVKVTLR